MSLDSVHDLGNAPVRLHNLDFVALRFLSRRGLRFLPDLQLRWCRV